MINRVHVLDEVPTLADDELPSGKVVVVEEPPDSPSIVLLVTADKQLDSLGQGKPELGLMLNCDQQAELDDLLYEFKDAFF